MHRRLPPSVRWRVSHLLWIDTGLRFKIKSLKIPCMRKVRDLHRADNAPLVLPCNLTLAKELESLANGEIRARGCSNDISITAMPKEPFPNPRLMLESCVSLRARRYPRQPLVWIYRCPVVREHPSSSAIPPGAPTHRQLPQQADSWRARL